MITGSEKAPDSQSLSAPKLLLWSLLVYLALNWSSVVPVLLNGELLGPDDFLRMDRVESWLSGQAWFDLEIHRLAGSDIHWSRIIDVPLAALAWVFSFFVSLKTALLLVSIIWPAFLFVASIGIVAKICLKVGGQHARFLALLFTGLNSFTMLEFVPGRIDHHNVQIVLLMICLAGLFSISTWRVALAVGVTLPLSTAIGLETIFLYVPVLAALALMWVFGAARDTEILKRTGFVMAATSSILFVTTVPPASYQNAGHICDAYSPFYFLAILGVSAGFVILAFLSDTIDGREKRSVLRRLSAGILFAVVMAGGLIYAFPECLGGPLGSVSEELKLRWLGDVTEAQGLIAVAMASGDRWISGVAYLCLMLVVSAVVTWKKGSEIPHLYTLFAVLLACALASLWQMRMLRTGIYTTIPFCIIAAGWAMDLISARFSNLKPVSITLQVLACALLSSYIWAVLALPFAPEVESNTVKSDQRVQAAEPQVTPKLRNPAACFGADDLSVLAALPQGLVISDLNTAAPLLVHTDHSTISGPYHRNGDAILQVYDFFQSETDLAKAQADKLSAQYVAVCRASGGIKVIDQTHLNARIWRNDLPDWLQWVSHPNARLAVLKVNG